MTTFDDCYFCAALKVLEAKCRVHQTPFILLLYHPLLVI